MRDVYEDCRTELYRTFWRTGQGVYLCGEANPQKGSRRVTNSSHPMYGEERRMNCVESQGYDPKPGDLSVGRLKFSERGMEGRTGDDLQISRMTYV